MTAFRWACLASLILGCATPPKPRELSALEQLRAGDLAKTAADRAPALVKAADSNLRKSQKEWESHELTESVRFALLGTIKLGTAIALVEQDLAVARKQAASTELAHVANEQRLASEQLADARDDVEILEQLKQANLSVAEQRQQANASEKVSAAEIALKTADTVNAEKYASEPYSTAAKILERAKAEQKSGNWEAALASAMQATQQAERAFATAKPLYDAEEKTKERQSRDEALARDAARIPKITVQRRQDGDVARLVLPLHGLFKRKRTQIRQGRDAILEPVAELLKKYPDYPVQIVGYTDNRGRRAGLVAISNGRAHAVFENLIRRGCRAKRFVVSGQGPDNPIANNRSSSGRNKNNRVEVVFMYQ